jgi:hypothetical protein
VLSFCVTAVLLSVKVAVPVRVVPWHELAKQKPLGQGAYGAFHVPVTFVSYLYYFLCSLQCQCRWCLGMS